MALNSEPAKYHGGLIGANWNDARPRAWAARDYAAMLRETMCYVADRQERDSSCPWLDMKFDIITGRDFPDDDPVRGKGTVCGWVQGRALESLAGHAAWLESAAADESKALAARLDNIMRKLLVNLRRVRAMNSGHLFFFMTPEGHPFSLDADQHRKPIWLDAQSPVNFSDIFGAKGMCAAARRLGDKEAGREARDWLDQIMRALWNGEIVSDQQALDTTNPVTPMPGRHTQAPFMLMIGAAAQCAALDQNAESIQAGLRIIQYLLDKHTNLPGRFEWMRPWLFWEFIGDDGEPYRSEGRILSDPGHALEFAGLALKFTGIAKKCRGNTERRLGKIHAVEKTMIRVIQANYENGVQPAGGICKLTDLLADKPVNSDMPWWSLPEAMRAALHGALAADEPSLRGMCLRIHARCHDAFAAHYVRPDRYFMAVQTRSADGRVAQVIPATADADPGYHTGLCLIDCLRLMSELT
ncbi:MAG: AGE family epimerase/isomerase [bacterium]